MMRLVHFLGNEAAYRVSVLECVEENLIAPLIEFLDFFALHVGLAGVAELPAETSRCKLARDALGDQLYALHDESQVRDRQRNRAFGHDMTRESDAAAHLSPFPKAFARCGRQPRSSMQPRGVPTSPQHRLADPSATDPTHPGSVARTSMLLQPCRAA